MSPFVDENSTLSPCFSCSNSTISFGMATRRLLPTFMSFLLRMIGMASRYPRDNLLYLWITLGYPDLPMTNIQDLADSHPVCQAALQREER